MLLRPKHVSYLPLTTQRVKFDPPNLDISGARKGDPPMAKFPNASHASFMNQLAISHDPSNLDISGCDPASQDNPSQPEDDGGLSIGKGNL